MTARSIVFPPFRLDLPNQCLWRGSARIELTPKAFAVLAHLAARPGQLVCKEELLQAVWPTTFVGDGVLKVSIGEVRKALGDPSKFPRFIETAHRRGYRFIASVSTEEAEPERREESHTAALYAAAGRGSTSVASPRAPVPVTRYATAGDVNIAYQVVGDGPIDLVFVMGWVSHLELFWAEPSFARFLSRLASFSRLILFDKRGTGLSDRVPVPKLPTLEERMDDLRAVLMAVGSERAALCGVSEGGPLSVLFAATYPEKTAALVMIGSYARRLRDTDYPWAPTAEEREEFCEELQALWGGPVGLEERAPTAAADREFREWWATYLRMGASPGAAVALTRMNADIDVRRVLPSVRVPTLVLHRTGDRCLRIEEGRYLASHIPDARLIELPGEDHLPFVGDQDALLDEIEEFLTGVRHTAEPDRVLATVLCVEFGDGANRSVEPDAWPRLRTQVHRELDWFRGRALAARPHGPLATFDGPARAVRCACALAEHAVRLGVPFRAGVHTGECDTFEDGVVGGHAVELACRVLACAVCDEVLVSNTVRDLIAGSGIRFQERGPLSAPDMMGDWRVFQVDRTRH